MSSLSEQARKRVAPPRKPKADASKGNRFVPLNNVVDHHIAEMTPAEVKVFMVLFRHIDKRSSTVARSHNQLADDCGIDRRSAIRAVNALIDRGVVKRTSKGSNLTGEPNTYSLPARG